MGSKQHLRLVVLFPVNMAVVMLRLYKVEDRFDLVMLVVHAMCILSMLLCFEPIALYSAECSEYVEQRIQERRDVVNRCKKRDEDFNIFRKGERAYHDMIEYRILPLMDVMGVVEQIFNTNSFAFEHEKAEELLRKGNECVESFHRSLGPPQDWLWKPLGAEWKDKEGKALQKFAKMEHVRNADEDKRDQIVQLVKTLDEGKKKATALEAARVQAKMFIQGTIPEEEVSVGNVVQIRSELPAPSSSSMT